MSFVHTAFGRGQIVGEETVRGRKQYLVAGNGFKLWVDEADAQIHTGAADFDFEPAEDVNEENSTDLPYNPEPQFPVEGFSDEQTIQPNHELDADDRLSPADSLTFDEVGDREYPGPAEHLFARRSAAFSQQDFDSRGVDNPRYLSTEELIDHHRNNKGQYLSRDDMDYAEAVMEELIHREEDGDPEAAEYNEISFRKDAGLSKDKHYPEADDFIDWLGARHYPEIYHAYDPDIRAQYADEARRSPEEMEDLARMLEDPYFGSDDAGVIMDGTRHLAGLSDKYIQIEADADHYNDPVVRFRDDPIREINRLAHSLSDVHDDDRMDHYAALVDSDPMLREAAWSDVRQKAQRIRREGKMDVHDIDNNQIYATVHGDHGDYDVMIVKGGLGGNSITQWTCTCDWGRHAFKRKVLHVGRLCSHGLAGWLEMQSHELHDVAEKHPYKKRAAHDEVTLEDLIGPPYEEDHGRVPASRPRREIDPELAELLDEDYLREHGYRTADVIDDYKSFNDEYNDGHVDKATADNFISRPHQAGGIEPMEPEDVDKLYNYVEDNKTEPGRRNYEVPYTLDPDKAYKKAEVLRTSPHSLTPDLKFIPKGEDEHFVDVEEDERETTGPDQIVHFSSRTAGYDDDPEGDWGRFMEDMAATAHMETDNSGPVPVHTFPSSGSAYNGCQTNENIHDGDIIHVPSEGVVGLAGTWPAAVTKNYGQLHAYGSDVHDNPSILDGPKKDYEDKITARHFLQALEFARQHGYETGPYVKEGRRRYAGEELDPEPYRDFDGGGELLDELREESSTPLEEDFGNMRDRNDDVREIVEELREKGYDADQFVASRRRSSYGVGNQGAGPGGAFGQPGGGNWADEPFAGSGPDPKLWYESSEDYVDAHERPRYEDVTDLGDDDIIKYTKDKPKQSKTAWLPGKHKRQKDRPLLPEDYEEEDDAGRGITRLPSGEQAETLVVRRHHAWLDSPSPPSEDDVPADCVICGKKLDYENTTGVCSKRCQRELDEDNRRFDEGMAQQYEQELADEEELRHLGSVDPIEKFYKSGAADALNSGSRSGGGSFSDDAIAANAQNFLMRTAGRNYSLAEQRELEDEEHHLGARNLDGLDLAGTHYLS